MARRHFPDVPRRRILGRIWHKVVRMEPPTEPGFVRYLGVNEAPYSSPPSKSSISVELISYPFKRVGDEHRCDHDGGDDKRWRQTCLLAKQQDRPRTRYRYHSERQCAF